MYKRWQSWATANMHRLNDSMTEVMLITYSRTPHLRSLPTSINIGNAQIPIKLSVNNLGLTLDCHLTMNAHVSNIAQTCYIELCRFASIRRFLTCTATATYVSAFLIINWLLLLTSVWFYSRSDITLATDTELCSSSNLAPSNVI